MLEFFHHFWYKPCSICSSKWCLTVPCQSSARLCALFLSKLCPAQVLQQIVRAVSQEEDSTPFKAGISIFPPFYPELTPLPWHKPQKKKCCLSLVECTHARTQHVPQHGHSDCALVSTLPNSITLVCSTPLIPSLLLLYRATIIPLHQQICMYFHATI